MYFDFTVAREKTDVISDEMCMCGYFCIITSKMMSAKDALELYKSRDTSEKLFSAEKSFLGNRGLRVQSDESAETKLFIAFVALKELEKIEMTRYLDNCYRLDHAVTNTQKTILKAFGIDATRYQVCARTDIN